MTRRNDPWFRDLDDAADFNDGQAWSDMDIAELKNAIECGDTIAAAAEILGRSIEQVADKAKELGFSTTRH